MNNADENVDIDEKCSGLTLQLLVDIHGVHSALLFGQSQRSSYPVDTFIEDVEKAENITHGTDDYSDIVSENKNQFTLSFYPLYLVNDSVFDVMACHYAVSLVVNNMINNKKNINGLHIRSVVVPAAICSRYDVEEKYQPTFINAAHYLQNVSSSNQHVTRNIDIDISSVPKMSDVIQQLIASIHGNAVRNMVVVFNRQKVAENDLDTVTVFECLDWNELVEFERNYFISVDFCVNAGGLTKSGNGLRCWLTFGVGQRLRFYPEYAVWIIPHLFVRSTSMSKYQEVQSLYGEDYKHGWRVALDDEIFNKYYHIITGFEHISNNYNREEVAVPMKYIDDDDSGLRDHLERTMGPKRIATFTKYTVNQAYDSDAVLEDILSANHQVDGNDSNVARTMGIKSTILRALKFEIFRFENLECKKDAVHQIDDCPHIESVIRNLQKFQECALEIDALSVVHFELESIINGYDHLVRVHDFLSDETKRSQIEEYINQRVTCERGADCQTLKNHGNRMRERDSKKGKQQIQMDEVDALCGAVSDAIHSVHCYVLHRNDNLYRLSNAKNGKFQSRFGTEPVSQQMIEEDDTKDGGYQKLDESNDEAPLGINFGLNVLQWLPYGVKPHHHTLREEFLKNPDSTIDRQLMRHYLMLCIAKIKGTKFTVNEMLCLKIYSDTNELQALLRRAHWTVTLDEVRKMYYQWAMGLYQTHLYHGTPIPLESGKSKPYKLFHGLSRLFTMTHELPIYNGPFSTTIAKSVATTFSNNQGLIWMIQSTYANPLRFCIGIPMDWISAFQHELEVLLYNQSLPIQKTETFDDADTVLVDHLMFSLNSRAAPILEQRVFWNQLGIKFQANWIPLMVKHKLFLEPTKCDTLTIFQRLRKELDIAFFKFMQMFCEMAMITESDTVILENKNVSQTFSISDYVFTVGLEASVSPTAVPKKFDGSEMFSLCCDDVFHSDTKSLDFTVFVKGANDSFDWTPIHSLILPRYRFSKSTPLLINESVDIPRDRNEVLQIQTASDMVIGPKVVVNGEGVGRDNDGGTVRLIARGNVTNKGTVCCNGGKGGRGGVIYIVCDSFANIGTLSCEPSGRIYIFCREYINNGTVSPQPVAMETKRNGLATADADATIGEYPLSVIDYIFHCTRNMEAAKGTADFFRTLGIRVQTELIQCIVDQRLLFHDIHLLADKHNIEFFGFYESILDLLVLDDDENLRLRDGAVTINDSQVSTPPISDYIFMVQMENSYQSEKVECRFVEKSEFEIPCKAVLDQYVIKPLEIWAKPIDESVDFVRIKSMVKPQYIFDRKNPLQISESITIPPINRKKRQSGTIVIRCSSDIEIGPKVIVSGSNIISNAKGPVIRVVSKRTITNKGTLCCNALGDGEGGDIYIVCDSFVNTGALSCEPDGRIYIFCREYINNGTVSPRPMVMETKQNHSVTSDTMIGDYPLSAVDYLLHCIRYEFAMNVTKKDFYRTIGIEMRTDWIPPAVDHKLLFGEVTPSMTFFSDPISASPKVEESEFAEDGGALSSDDGKEEEKETKTRDAERGALAAKGATAVADVQRVIDVLGHHLEFGFFKFYDAVRSAMVLDDNGDVVLGVDGQRGHSVQRGISEYIFMIRNENENESEVAEFRFEKVSEFKIPEMRSMNEAAITPSHVYVKPIDGSFGFVRLKSLLQTQHVFKRETPLRITESFNIPPADRRRGQSGNVYIHCSSDIGIGQNVAIKGAETMMEANGCEFRIISKRNITNKGTLSFNGLGDGDGGDIYIIADSFVNDGKMECKSSSENGNDGRIRIFCRQFVNRGIITPDPRVTEWIPMEPVEYQSVSQSLSEWLPSRRSPEEYPSEWGVGSLPIKGNEHWEVLYRNHELWRRFERVCNLGNASKHINAVWRWRGEDDENMAPLNGKELVENTFYLTVKEGMVKLFEDGIIDKGVIFKSLKDIARIVNDDLYDDEGNIMVFVCNVYLDKDERGTLERSGYWYCSNTSDIRMVLCGSINLNLKEHYGIK